MEIRLLLADVRSPSRDALERFFCRCGFRVATASDPTECIAKLRWLKPDLWVVGLDMPEDERDELVWLLRARRGWVTPPITLVVGAESPAALSEKTGVPESCCFRRPIPTEAFLDRVGLMAALIDLKRRSEPVANMRPLADVCVEDEDLQEACLV